MADARLLTDALADPGTARALDAGGWNAVLRMARRERLLATLGLRLAETGLAAPDRARLLLEEAVEAAAQGQTKARFEIEQALAVLDGIDAPVVLLKGSAYLAAGLPPVAGRSIGDLDLLLPRAALEAAEARFKAAGWIAAKADAYDDAYYRRWMHELPPLIHADRGSVLDLHHSILPLTARLKPDAAALVAASLPSPIAPARLLCPPDMVLHSAAHLFYDGDLDGGLRNLWDIHQLLHAFATQPGFWSNLRARAALHQLEAPLARALRWSARLYGTPVDPALAGRFDALDRLFGRRLVDRNAYGLRERILTERLLYMRAHWLRMPPALLARHLFTKWRMRGSSSS